MIRLLVFSCLALAIAGCNRKISTTPNLGIGDLKSTMIGSYNSGKQEAADSAYYNISLHMYPIWEDKGHYLYVEQAMNSMQERPYRQRVYQLIDLGNNKYESKVYTFKDETAAIGKWKDPDFWKAYNVSDIEERVGCSVFLTYKDGVYVGSTDGKSCLSSLRGATYATSKVTIFPDRIESWDQGFNDEDIQVWGAEKGGYIFDKLK